MNYCKTCLQPDTRPNTFFNANGICPACDYFYKNKNIQWNFRENEFIELIKKYKSDGYYNCILGISGGKDSTRQAIALKEKYNLNPLLVCLAYPPQQVTEIGCSNVSNLINKGFDVEITSLAPETWKKLIKIAFFKYGNWCKPTEQALKASAIIAALNHNIKLVFWGENPGLQLGDMKTVGKTPWDGNNNRYTNTVQGGMLSGLLMKVWKKICFKV